MGLPGYGKRRELLQLLETERNRLEVRQSKKTHLGICIVLATPRTRYALLSMVRSNYCHCVQECFKSPIVLSRDVLGAVSADILQSVHLLNLPKLTMFGK